MGGWQIPLLPLETPSPPPPDPNPNPKVDPEWAYMIQVTKRYVNPIVLRQMLDERFGDRYKIKLLDGVFTIHAPGPITVDDIIACSV